MKGVSLHLHIFSTPLIFHFLTHRVLAVVAAAAILYRRMSCKTLFCGYECVPTTFPHWYVIYYSIRQSHLRCFVVKTCEKRAPQSASRRQPHLKRFSTPQQQQNYIDKQISGEDHVIFPVFPNSERKVRFFFKKLTEIY